MKTPHNADKAPEQEDYYDAEEGTWDMAGLEDDLRIAKAREARELQLYNVFNRFIRIHTNTYIYMCMT